MCGIAFAKGKELHRVLGRQRERGLDGVGISTPKVHGFRGFHPSRNDLGHFISDKVRFDWYVEYIKEIVTQEKVEDKFCLFHHRKSSVGSVSLENTHPLRNKKFSIMQNGTERALRQWGDIEGIPGEKSDTFCLLTFLSNKCNTLEDIISILNRFSDKLLDIGILLIVEEKTNRILFYSDGKRESYITFGEKENTIDMIESWHGTNRKICHVNEGYIIFDFKGNIVDMLLTKINEEEKAKMTSTYGYTNDEGELCRPDSYTTNKLLNASCVTKIEDDINKIFQYNVKRSINKGDVSLKEIRDIPETFLDTLIGEKALKKFKHTYTQALKRAMKFDTKNNNIIDSINELFTVSKEDNSIEKLLEPIDDQILLEDYNYMDDKYPIKKTDLTNHFDFDRQVRAKYSDFLDCIDWTHDMATEEEAKDSRSYPTIITDIDLERETVSISHKDYSTTIFRNVDLLIDKKDNKFSIMDSFNNNKKMNIKVHPDTIEPILVPCNS